MPLVNRLLLLLTLALLPAVGLLVLFEGEARQAREAQVRDEALRLALLVNSDVESITDGARQLLAGLSSIDAVRDGDKAGCETYFRTLLPQIPRYSNLYATDLTGRVSCSALPSSRERQIGDRAYFRRALETGSFAIGDYRQGRVSGREVLHFAQPFRDGGGRVAGVVIASLDLDWLGARLASLHLPAGATAVIADRNGNFLARYPYGAELRGKQMVPEALTLLEKTDPGVQELRNSAGSRRIIGYVPPTIEPVGLFVAVGLDRSQILAGLGAANRRGIALILGGTLLALGLGWLTARRFLQRPVRALLRVAERWRKGDLAARARAEPALGREPGDSEFGCLASAFDAMAEAAAEREQALRESEARFRALFQAVPVGVVVMDPATLGFAAFNDRTAEQLGYTAGEFANLTLADIDERPREQLLARAREVALMPPGTRYQSEVRQRRKDGMLRDILVSNLRIDLNGRPMTYAAWQDITDLKAAGQALRDSEERFRLAAEGTGMATWDLNPATGELIWSPPLFEQLGLPPDPEGRASLEAWARCLHPEDLPAVREARDRAVRDGSLYHTIHRIRRADTGELRWRENFGRLVETSAGRRLLGVAFDITERKQAEERQALLMREVDHRAKNALAVVQSVVRLTRAEDQKAYVRAVEGRIAALARAHGLLARERWSGAALRQLAEEELAAHAGEGRVALSGPALRLGAEAVQPVSMVLHELVTNAARHGALSVRDGRLELSWSVDPATGGLRLVWQEHGGPPITDMPLRRGFGSTLIAATLRGQLGGSQNLEWRPEGLRCEITLPARHLRPDGPAAPVKPAEGPNKAAASLAGRRVLVAEDEALVALEIEQSLLALGCEVLGPANTLAEALRLAASTPAPEVAVLDINLGGQASFPVADLLAGLGVPVIYASGYSELPPQRAHSVLLLCKPLARGELEAALRRLLADGVKQGAAGASVALAG